MHVVLIFDWNEYVSFVVVACCLLCAVVIQVFEAYLVRCFVLVACRIFFLRCFLLLTVHLHLSTIFDLLSSIHECVFIFVRASIIDRPVSHVWFQTHSLSHARRILPFIASKTEIHVTWCMLVWLVRISSLSVRTHRENKKIKIDQSIECEMAPMFTVGRYTLYSQRFNVPMWQ